MTAFFIPGIAREPEAVERAYARLRRQTELEMGRCPTSRRILSVWTRRGTLDCVTEVGRRDPWRGGTVLAIFDMGSHQPFVVWWQQELGADDRIPEVLGCNAYSVLEFDA
jgi:hypothetical protein